MRAEEEPLAAAQRTALLRLHREVAAGRQRLLTAWAGQLAATSRLDGVPPASLLARHMVREGGYALPLADLAGCEPALSERMVSLGQVRSGWWYSRGLDYYLLDDSLHPPGAAPSLTRKLDVLEQRLPQHHRGMVAVADHFGGRPLRFAEWLGLLSLVEAALNDLWTIHWAWLHLHPDQMDRLPDALDHLCRLSVELGWRLWQPEAASLDLPSSVQRYLRSDVDQPLRELRAALAAGQTFPLRAVREGDQPWQVAATFQSHVEPLLRAQPRSEVLIASEAFGALHVGATWHQLMTPPDRARTQVTIVRGSVHEDEMDRHVADLRTAGCDAEGRLVLHADDSVFTGRTHRALVANLRGSTAAVHLCPLTIDLGTPFNHPDEFTAGTSGAAHAVRRLDALARSVDGRLPAAVSLWARRRGARTRVSEGHRLAVTRGSDLLLAGLWQRFDDRTPSG